MQPTDVANAYFAAVRAKDIETWIALFAEDARYILPDGTAFDGKAAIRAAQEKVFTSGSAPFPTPQAMIAGESGIAVEVQTQLPDGKKLRTTNVYHLDGDGLIERLSVYKQGW